MQVIISFDDPAVEKSALAELVGRFPFKTWRNGETMVPEKALAFLAREGMKFTVEGAATYE